MVSHGSGLSPQLWREVEAVKDTGFEDLLRWERAKREEYWDVIDGKYAEMLEEIRRLGWTPQSNLARHYRSIPLMQLMRLSATFYHNREAVPSRRMPHKPRAYELLRAIEMALKYKQCSDDAIKRMIDADKDGIVGFIERYIFKFQEMKNELDALVTQDEKPFLDNQLGHAMQTFDKMLLEYIKSEHAYRVFGELKEVYGRRAEAERERLEIEGRAAELLKDQQLDALRNEVQALREEKEKVLELVAKGERRAEEVMKDYAEREAKLFEQWQGTLDALHGFGEQYDAMQRRLCEDMERFSAEKKVVLEEEAARILSSKNALETQNEALRTELWHLRMDRAEAQARLEETKRTLEERNAQVQSLEGEIERERGIITSLEERMEDLGALAERLEAEKSTTEADRGRIESELARARDTIETTRRELGSKEALLMEREQLLHELREGLEKGTAVTASEARAIESHIISRFIDNLHQHKELEIHAPNKKRYRIASSIKDDDAWFESDETASLCRKQQIPLEWAKTLPNNRRIALGLRGILGGTGVRLETHLHAHILTLAEKGCDDQKMTLKETNWIVDHAVKGARDRGYLCILCIASPTGFTEDAISRYGRYKDANLFVTLYDAQAQQHYYNAEDSNAKQVMRLFNFLEARDERIVRLAEEIRTLLLFACEGMVSEGYCRYETQKEGGDVRKAFELLEKEGAAEIIKKMDGVDGWVLRRIGGV
ncbi:MAG: hypothetical protein AB1665_03600 [Candidatus Thermoplasmatota archaeon]